MPFAPANDVEVFVQSTGEGIPVLLICGMISDHTSWAPLTPLLKNDFRLISFDNRGAGQTKLSTPNWTIDHMVADAVAVMDFYEIPRAHIIGHSMGGMIGLRLAASHKDRVASFVSMSSVNAPTKNGIAYFDEMADLYASELPKEDWYKLLFKVLFSPIFFENKASVKAAAQTAAAYPHVQTPQNLKRQVAALASIIPIELANIDVPVLAIAGDNDKVVIPNRTRTTLETLPDVSFKIIANAAHSVHWEAPDEVAKTIKEFLDEHSF